VPCGYSLEKQREAQMAIKLATKAISEYDIAKEFMEGFAYGLKPASIPEDKSEHWRAGYGAGYGLRGEKNKWLNDYLLSLGCNPMKVIHIK